MNQWLKFGTIIAIEIQDAKRQINGLKEHLETEKLCLYETLPQIEMLIFFISEFLKKYLRVG